MSIAALIFDVDGTLAETEAMHLQAFNNAFEVVGLPWRWTPERYAELLKTTGGKERMAAYLNSLDMTATRRRELRARIPDIHRRKTAFYARRIRQGPIALRDGIGRLIAEARTASVRLAIASTTTRESIDALLTSTLGPDAPRWFAVIAAGDEVERKKPAPDIYELVLDALDARGEDCVAFEDSGRGLAAARGAGIFTVVTPTYWTRDDNFSGADLILSRLGDAEHPLVGDDAQRAGNIYLGLAELEELHAQWRRSRVGRVRGHGAVPGRRET
jgi:HAD superfamily hydrolase (TIGR01509 family)